MVAPQGISLLDQAAYSVIVFSKDRPWQLQQYLRSFHKFAQTTKKVEIFVIWAASNDEYASRYQKIISDNEAPHPLMWRETSFANDLDTILSIANGQFLIWGVDDVLFYRPFDLDVAAAILDRDESVLSFAMRMSPAINYCQPAHMGSEPPLFEPIGDNLIKYNRITANGLEAKYGWEVSASMYRTQDVKETLHCLRQAFPQNYYSHPNLLEMQGATLVLKGLWADKPWTICPLQQVCSTITINRVQEVCPNTVAADIPAELLLKYFDDNRNYNYEKYAQEHFNQIHIGNFYVV